MLTIPKKSVSVSVDRNAIYRFTTFHKNGKTKCYFCHKIGHIQTECPYVNTKSQDRAYRASKWRNVTLNINQDN